RINLTSIRSEEECITRHFGESLYLGQYEHWTEHTRLVDVGTGSGFPGLALKLIFPETPAMLLEPVAKKRAFLKEVIRACEIKNVAVRPERLDQFITLGEQQSVLTARAVGNAAGIISHARRVLEENGRLHLWLSRQQAEALRQERLGVEWVRQVHVPLSDGREILTGILAPLS
ncbi:MAG: 16S rRNA (guanine(527)-N(7))-methyltransferase RsmG, partial [Terriglobia bacterium]